MANDYVEAGKRVAAQIAAEALAMGDLGYARAIWREVGRQLPKDGTGRPPVPPDAPAESGWLARIMLFDERGELQADTMPDAAVDAAPDVMRGTLALVGRWLRETAEEFHAANGDGEPQGLDAATLERSILSLRVSLSRNGGQTWWRVPYAVNGAAWRATVRVERAIQ